jgi:photosystem II stability/assembly factor-like uncharacterized protein
VAVTTPPGKSETEHDRDLAQRVADLEALIEEARRRARRRRRIYAAAVLTALGAAAWVSFDMGGHGGISLGGSAAGGRSGASPPRTASESWVPTGGPEGGDVLSLAVNPSDPSIVYAGGWGTVFKSTDGGGSWRAVSHKPWTQVTALAIDPMHPATVYAGTAHGVGKTIDGGRHWRMVNAGLFTRCESGAASHCTAADRFRRWGRERSIHALLIDPNRPDSIYALVDGGLFMTANGGRSWRYERPHLGPFSFLSAAAIDPAHAGTVYASWTDHGYGGDSNLYKTTNSGASWRLVAATGGKPSFASLVIDPASPGTILATDSSRPGVYTSTDGGTTWNLVVLPLASADGLELFAGSRGALYATTDSGTVFASADVGATWQTVTANGGPGSIVTDPANPQTVYGGGDGVEKSVDGGHTWQTSKHGFVDTSITSLALAPGRATPLLAADGGRIFRSSDRGKTWRAPGKDLDAGVGTLAVDPQHPRTIFAGTPWSGLAHRSSSGLYKSLDSGVTWRAVQTGFHEDAVQAIAIDPRRPSTIYVGACTALCGVWSGTFLRTDDGGATWRRIKLPGRGITVRAIAVDPRTGNTVFAGTVRGALFRSTDGGSTWHQVARAHHRRDPFTAIAIDPHNPDTVYAGIGINGWAGIGISRILKSTDGGATWVTTHTGSMNPSIQAIAVDPRNSQLVLAAATLHATGGGAQGVGVVLRSTDGGESWQQFHRGLSAADVTALAIDPTGRIAYAGTNGEGVETLRLP